MGKFFCEGGVWSMFLSLVCNFILYESGCKCYDMIIDIGWNGWVLSCLLWCIFDFEVNIIVFGVNF